MKRIKYKDCAKIKPFKSTVWLVEFESGIKEIAVWHKKAKIEDIVKAMKLQNPKTKFTVCSVDVGHFRIRKLKFHLMGNGGKLNQKLELILPGDEKYTFDKRKKVKKKKIDYDDIPF